MRRFSEKFTPRRQGSLLRTRRELRGAASVAVALGAICVATPALAQSNDQGWSWHMHDGWNHMMGWGGGMFGGFGMLLFWGVIIVLLVLLVRGFVARRSSQSLGSGSSALDILQQRYAKGEISNEEYEERKKTLQE